MTENLDIKNNIVFSATLDLHNYYTNGIEEGFETPLSCEQIEHVVNPFGNRQIDQDDFDLFYADASTLDPKYKSIREHQFFEAIDYLKKHMGYSCLPNTTRARSTNENYKAQNLRYDSKNQIQIRPLEDVISQFKSDDLGFTPNSYLKMYEQGLISEEGLRQIARAYDVFNRRNEDYEVFFDKLNKIAEQDEFPLRYKVGSKTAISEDGTTWKRVYPQFVILTDNPENHDFMKKLLDEELQALLDSFKK